MDNKPNWKDAPEWAQWLAMDESGTWYWYETKPELGNSIWLDTGKCIQADLDIDWKESLQQRPAEND